jgi:GT2 family glycosyltransferase
MQNTLAANELIRNAVNLGFAGGNNVGIARALEMKCDFVLLLNSDADISEIAASQLLDQFAKDPELAIVGPRIEEISGTSAKWFAGGRDISRYVNTRIPLRPSAAHCGSSFRDADYVPGMAVFVRSSVFGEIGLLDDDYFFSGEIADFCERARKAGRRVAVDPSVAASHDISKNGVGLRDSLHVYYGLRNRFLFSQKHRKQQQAFLSVKWSVICLLVALRALVGGRRARLRAALLAMRDGLARRYGDRNSLFGV